MQETFSEVVADVLQLAPGELTDKLSPELLESWDSLRQLNLAARLERAFAIVFSPAEVRLAESVGDFRDLVAKKTGSVPA